MKVLASYKELEGKTIAYAAMAQNVPYLLLATTEGDVLMFIAEYQDDEEFAHEHPRHRILGQHRVMAILQSSEGASLREELTRRGLFDIATYENEVCERREKERVKRELASCERVKEKIERKGRNYK